MCQDRCLSEGELECVERLLVRWSPLKLGVLSGEMSKRRSGFREVYDKATVKVGKADERLDLLLTLDGAGHLLMASVLAGSIAIPFGDTINPRNSIEVV